MGLLFYADELRCAVFVDDLNGMGLRVRVYGGDRLRRDRLVGEKFVSFSSLDLDELEEQSQGRGQSLEKLIELEPRSNIEVSPCVRQTSSYRLSFLFLCLRLQLPA